MPERPDREIVKENLGWVDLWIVGELPKVLYLAGKTHVRQILKGKGFISRLLYLPYLANRYKLFKCLKRSHF